MAKTLKLGTCTAPGCNATATGGRCSKHPRPPVNRTGSDARPYSAPEFKKHRAAIMARRPICNICKKWPAKVVDHINGNNKDNRLENLQPACYGCNTKKGKKPLHDNQRG
jgi:5-methylcytosine-specific restriction endonuclease McrA